MKAFFNHFSFEFRTGIRNQTLLLLNYLFPLGFYAMMGLIMPGLNPTFLETMVPAMVVFAVLASTLLGSPELLVTAREAGIFRSYKVNGVPAISILVIPALTTVFHMAIVSAIITVTAPLLFDAPLPVNWPGFALTFLALAFACAGLGALIGVISPDSRMTVLWSQLIFLPSMMLGGMMIPYSQLPETAGRVSRLLPATMAMNTFRGLAMDLTADFDATGSLLVLLAGGVLAFGLAIYLFNWDRRNATQRGHPLMALLVLIPFGIGLLLAPHTPTLKNTAWELESLSGDGILAGTTITIEFPDDQVAGSAGCNYYGGTYQAKSKDLSVTNLFSTEMACLEEGVMDQETQYLKAVQAAASYQITADRLEIFDEAGTQILVFVTQ